MRTIQVAEGVNLQEGVHFNYFKDGNGVEIPYALVDHEYWSPRKNGVVEIEFFRVNRNAQQGETVIDSTPLVKASKDPKTGIWFGMPQGVAEDKSIRWQSFPLSMQMRYDLSNLQDRRAWAIISRSPYLDGSPTQVNRKPLYKVTDYQERALKRMEQMDEENRAFELIKKMNEYDLRDTALVMKVNASAYDAVTLKAELLFMVKSKFKDFLNYHDNANKHVIVLLYKALQKGVILRQHVSDKEFGSAVYYKYGDIKMGTTEGEVIMFLAARDNETIFKNIVIQLEQLDKQHSFQNTKVVQADVKTESDEMASLKAQVAEMRKQLAEKDVRKEETTDFEEEKIIIGASFEHDDLSKKSEDELKGIAKALNVRGHHLIKSKETLIQKIIEAKKDPVPTE